jgi:hypothetical protein
VTIDSVPWQDLHVELVWDTAYGDADLHMVCAGCSPAASWYMASPLVGENDCWYNNTTAAWPPGGAAGNATLDLDDTNGYGPENININNSPASGDYEIGVAYYCSHSLGPAPAPGDGPTTATVNIYCGGVLIDSIGGITLSRTGRFVDVARVTWPGCAVTNVTSYTWTSLVAPTYYTSPIHCSLPCTNNADCGGGEVCTGGACVLD